MKHRYYTKEDYPQIVKWWKSWDWAAIPEVALPKTGIIISKDGVDLAASFLYATDSCICWGENFITNKDAPRDLRKGSVEFLIEKTIEEAKNQGFLILMSSVNHKGLIGKLLNAGYEQNIETDMTNLVRIL